MGAFLHKTLSLHFNLFTPMRDSFLLIHTQKERHQSKIRKEYGQQPQSNKPLKNTVIETVQKERHPDCLFHVSLRWGSLDRKGIWPLRSTMSFTLKTCEKGTCPQGKKRELKIWHKLDGTGLKMIYSYFSSLSRQKPHHSGPRQTVLPLTDSVFLSPPWINSQPWLLLAKLSPSSSWGTLSSIFPSWLPAALFSDHSSLSILRLTFIR